MTPKDGRLESPVYLSWVRRQRCRAGEALEALGGARDCMGRIDPHHVDHKGMGGARCRDDRTIPLCRMHHDYAHAHCGAATTVIPIDVERWVDETLRRFIEQAGAEEVRLYLKDLERWKERPLAVAW